MTDRITQFNLHWYDCGCTCYGEVIHELLQVRRNRSEIVFLQYTAPDNRNAIPANVERCKLDKGKVEEFFDFLGKCEPAWSSDYSVEVCDGSEWKMQLWHSSHKVTKICGTVEYPPLGKEIEGYIVSFVKKASWSIVPRIFGCSE